MRRNRVCEQLENYDFTRKSFAIITLDILTQTLELEAQQAQQNAVTIAALGSSIAAVLAAVV